MFTFRHYSHALFSCAKETKRLDKFLLDLELVYKILKQKEEFKKILLNPEILFEEKTRIFKKIFGNKILLQVYSFISLLIKNKNLNLLEDIFYHFKKLVLEEKETQEVEIISRGLLSLAFKNKIIKLIEKKIGKKVKLYEKVRPEIFGGIILKIGDEVLDLSLRRKLEVLRQNLI